jgi:tripartite-type tricarboxylate transporter receptor subunit TctC
MIHFPRIAWLIVPMLVGLQVAAPSCAQSGAYPNKPVRLVVPFAPGGGTDIVARVIAQKVSEAVGQPVVVDNRPGAGGTVGVETVVRAAPDGYTLAMVSGSYGTNAAIYKLPYDPVRDIQSVVMIGESGFIVVVHPQVPVKSLKELVSYAKSKPGVLNYASTGPGGITHLSTEYFILVSGAQMTHIPFKGTGPALNALMGNQLQLLFGAMPAAIPLLKQGRLRGLAVTTPKRSDVVPDLPTIAEMFPGFEVVLWYGVLGPKGLPGNIVALWNGEIAKTLQTNEMKERMAGEGLQPAGGPPDQFLNAIKRDVEKWRKVVRDAKVTVTS